MNRIVLKDGLGEEILLPNYKLDRYLGHGSYSVVNRAKDENGAIVAIKMIDLIDMREYRTEIQVNNEIAILQTLENPHVIEMYEAILTPSHLCIVMEYASSGDFFSFLESKEKFDEDEARPFFLQLMSGLEYCHQNMVAHRDLKLENLVLDENLNLKISDFGLSTIMKDDYLVNGNCGSPHYAAPEVWSRHPYLGPPVDIWSCGVILYIMLCAKYPFQGRVVPDFFHQLENGRFIPTDEHLSSNARDLIAGMLTVNPTQRLTIPEIRQHPWFQA